MPIDTTRVERHQRARSLLLVGALGLLSACASEARQTIVVAPRPVTRLDSASLAGFSTAVIELMRRVAGEDSLYEYGRYVPEVWQACFAYSNFLGAGLVFCGRMQNSVMRISFVESGLGYNRRTFDDRAERIRRHLIESLSREFGESRVRECGRRPEDCPRLVQIDSGG